MRPRVIVHNSVTIDGALGGFELDMAGHYAALGELQADGFLLGSSSARMAIEREGAVPAEEEADHRSRTLEPSDTRALWFVPDSKGSLEGLLHVYRRFAGVKDLVVFVTRATPTRYRDWLGTRNYRVHEVGDDRVDLVAALSVVHDDYGVKRVVTDGGPTMADALFQAGVVDELSLLVFPNVVASGTSARLWDKLGKSYQLDLEDAWALENGAIHLRWTVRKP